MRGAVRTVSITEHDLRVGATATCAREPGPRPASGSFSDVADVLLYLGHQLWCGFHAVFRLGVLGRVLQDLFFCLAVNDVPAAGRGVHLATIGLAARRAGNIEVRDTKTPDNDGLSWTGSRLGGGRPVLLVHQRAREEKVGGRTVAGDRDVADDGDP